MNTLYARLALVATLIAGACCAAFAPALAQTSARAIDHGGTYFGSVVVQNDQQVDGDVTVIGGDAIIDGEVDGNVNAYGGSVVKEPGSVITGSVTQYGGDMPVVMPWMPSMGMIARENAKMVSLLAYGVVVVLIFLIFPVRVRTALDRVEHHPGLSAAVGALAIIASVPIAIFLFISLVGWPLLPLEFVAYVAGVLIGEAALGILVGRRLYELLHPHGTPSPLGALVLGLVVISAAEILPIVGWMVTALVWLVGLGAAVLAFIRETSFMGGMSAGAPQPAGPRPPIGGPPMATP